MAIGGEVGNTETQTPTGSYTATAINGRAGYDFGKYFGVEAEGALYLGGSATFSDQNEFTTREFEREMTSRYGLFLRGRIPVSERVSLFGRAGLGVRNETYIFRSFGIYQFDGSAYDETRSRDEKIFMVQSASAQNFKFQMTNVMQFAPISCVTAPILAARIKT